jgi:perosamine synthetase
MSKNNFIALSEPYIGGNAWKYVKECLDTGWVSSAGAYVETFERKLCAFTGAGHAAAVVNGTSGLQVALRLCGVGPGDEVLVPSLTFIAPVNAVRYLGAEPVFMDCDDFMNLDPVKTGEFLSKECRRTAKGLVNRKTNRPIKAILPVHIFGNPCDMEAIMSLARRHGLKVVEDATESLGSRYTEGKYKGRHTGTIGDFGVFSFNGNKIVTTGSGGMLVTPDAKMAERARYLTTQAKDDAVRYVHHDIGYNFRMTNMQAALGVAQLEQLPAFIRTKKKNYEVYRKALAGVPGLRLLGVPEGTAPNYWFYSLVIDKRAFGLDREALMAALGRAGIQTRPVWHLNHLQKPYKGSQAFKVSRAGWFVERVLNLPCSSGLTAAQALRVAEAIKRAGIKT